MVKNDFDADALTRAVEQGGKDLSDLTSRVDDLEEKFKPENLATALERTSKDSKRLDKLFSKLFCDMMEKDENVKAIVKKHMENVDRQAVNSFLKKWGGKLGFAAWSVALIVITTLVNHYFK